MGAGADEDLEARRPDWAATAPAHKAISAKRAITLKLEATMRRTGRWFVMVVFQNPKLESL